MKFFSKAVKVFIVIVVLNPIENCYSSGGETKRAQS